MSASPLSTPATPRQHSQQAATSSAAVVGSGGKHNMPTAAAADDDDDVISSSGNHSHTKPSCSVANCSALVEEQARYLVVTVAEELKLKVPEVHSPGPNQTSAAGFTTSASSRLTTAAASSLLVPQGTNSKKVKLFNKPAAACSSTGQPAAVKLPIPPPQTPADALAAIRSAVAAAATVMGFSIDDEASKLRVEPPAGAVMERWADVDPVLQPMTWQLLKALNDEARLTSSRQSHRNTMMVMNEVCFALEEGPPHFTVQKVAAEAAAAPGNGSSPKTSATTASIAATAAAKSTRSSGTVTTASSNNLRTAGFKFTATICITHHSQLLFTATGDGPNHKEAKRAAAAAALEQILTTLPGIVVRKYICLLNPTVADMLQQRNQQHQQVVVNDMERSMLLLDPGSSVVRKQRELLQQEQERQRKKAEADRAKRERQLAMEQAVHGARDQAESLQTLEAYPLTKAHMAKLLPDSTAVSVSGPMNPLQLLNIYKVQVDLVVHETITADQPDITMPGTFTCMLTAYTASEHTERQEAQQQQQQDLSQDDKLPQQLSQDDQVVEKKEKQRRQGPAPVACSQMSSLSKQGARHLAAASLVEQLLDKHAEFRRHAAAQEKAAERRRASQTSNIQPSAPKSQRPQRRAAVRQFDSSRTYPGNRRRLYGVRCGDEAMIVMPATPSTGTAAVGAAGVPYSTPPAWRHRALPDSWLGGRSHPTAAAAAVPLPSVTQQPPHPTTARPMPHRKVPPAGRWTPTPQKTQRSRLSAAAAPQAMTAATAAGTMKRHPCSNQDLGAAAEAVHWSFDWRTNVHEWVHLHTSGSSSTSSPAPEAAAMQSRSAQVMSTSPAAASHCASTAAPGECLQHSAAAGQQQTGLSPAGAGKAATAEAEWPVGATQHCVTMDANMKLNSSCHHSEDAVPYCNYLPSLSMHREAALTPGSSSSSNSTITRTCGNFEPAQPAAGKRTLNKQPLAAGAPATKRFKTTIQGHNTTGSDMLNSAAATAAPSHGMTAFPRFPTTGYPAVGVAHVDAQRSDIMPATAAAAARLHGQDRFATTNGGCTAAAAAAAVWPAAALAGTACSGRALADTHLQQLQSNSVLCTLNEPMAASSHQWTAEAAVITAVVPGFCASPYPAWGLQQQSGPHMSTLRQQQQQMQQQRQILPRYAILPCSTRPWPLHSINRASLNQQLQQQHTPGTMQQVTCVANSCSGGADHDVNVCCGVLAGEPAAAPQSTLLAALQSCGWTGFGAVPPPYAQARMS